MTSRKFPQSYRAEYKPQPDTGIIEEIKGAPQSLIEKLRHRARTDRYFLSKGVLGYKDVNPYTHGPLLRAVQHRDLKRRMYLMPRGHLKTTLATVTDFVGDAITDPDEFRGLILNEIEENAIGFLSEIKAHFENGEVLQHLFPELIPDRFSGPGSKWSNTKACLPRSTNYKEWTWEAAGIGRALASRHYKKIKCDDVIGFEASTSPAEMSYAIKFVKSLEPLLIDMEEDFIDFVGTRWSLLDLYREMLRLYGDDMLYFAREDIEVVPELPTEILREAGFKFNDPSEVIGTLQPIFPRKFSLRYLHRLSIIDPVLYYAQYKNNPVADGVKDFDGSKLRLLDIDRDGFIIYRDTEGRLQRYSREQLDVVMTCDPNSGELTAQDYPAIVVAAISPRDEVFVLDTWSRRVQPDKFVERIYEMWEYWQPRVCGIEKAGQQSTLFYFKKLAKERKTYINIEELKPKNRDKATRIRKSLQPIVAEHRMFIRKTQEIIRRQIRFHPDIENDDEIDALAYCTELFRPPVTRREEEEEERLASKIINSRSRVTGYGR